MHFVTGGACQGKRKWVSQYYDLENKNHLIYWGNGYKEEFKSPVELGSQTIAVLEGADEFIKSQLINSNNIDKSYFKEFFTDWFQWQEVNKQVIIIGNDIGKGIVPIDPFDRQWRDIVGWCYQDIVSISSRVDIIWSGINQTLKEC